MKLSLGISEPRCCSFTATVILTLPRELLVSCTASFPTPNFVFCRTQAIGHLAREQPRVFNLLAEDFLARTYSSP